MPIYENPALKEQMMKVALQQKQRGINQKARAAALQKVTAGIGQAATTIYTANAQNVLAQAKELGLESPEEVAGLKKVMEVAEKTGLSVEEIYNSEELMTQLMQEAKTGKTLQHSERLMADTVSRLGEDADRRDFDAIRAESDAANLQFDEMDALGEYQGEYQQLEQRAGGKLRLPAIEAKAKRDEGIAKLQPQISAAQSKGRDARSKSDIANKALAGGRRMQESVQGRIGEHKKRTEDLSKVQALKDLGYDADTLAKLRKSAGLGHRLDKLASSNLVGREAIGRQASAGGREGTKAAAAAALLKMKGATAKLQAETASTTSKTAGINADTAAFKAVTARAAALDKKNENLPAFKELRALAMAQSRTAGSKYDTPERLQSFAGLAQEMGISEDLWMPYYKLGEDVTNAKLAELIAKSDSKDYQQKMKAREENRKHLNNRINAADPKISEEYYGPMPSKLLDVDVGLPEPEFRDAVKAIEDGKDFQKMLADIKDWKIEREKKKDLEKQQKKDQKKLDREERAAEKKTKKNKQKTDLEEDAMEAALYTWTRDKVPAKRGGLAAGVLGVIKAHIDDKGNVDWNRLIEKTTLPYGDAASRQRAIELWKAAYRAAGGVTLDAVKQLGQRGQQQSMTQRRFTADVNEAGEITRKMGAEDAKVVAGALQAAKTTHSKAFVRLLENGEVVITRGDGEIIVRFDQAGNAVPTDIYQH